MFTRRQATLESVTAILRDPSMMFVLGAITLVATFGTDPLQDSLGRPMHWVGRRAPVKAA
jgi:hypothetical protein